MQNIYQVGFTFPLLFNRLSGQPTNWPTSYLANRLTGQPTIRPTDHYQTNLASTRSRIHHCHKARLFIIFYFLFVFCFFTFLPHNFYSTPSTAYWSWMKIFRLMWKHICFLLSVVKKTCVYEMGQAIKHVSWDNLMISVKFFKFKIFNRSNCVLPY